MDGDRAGSVARATREWTQFIILVFATVWGVYTFVYKETIVPAKRPATLVVTTSIEELGRSSDGILVRARIHAVNHTDKKVYVPALWYTAAGIKLKSLPGLLDDFKSQVTSAPVRSMTSRYSVEAVKDIVAVGTILETLDSYYEPTDETTNEIVFEVPVGRYDAIELRANFIITKDTSGLDRPTWSVAESGELVPEFKLMGRPYDPANDLEHRDWEAATGMGEDWSVSTLSLWPKSDSSR
jgi:hypothetical protein